MEETKKESTHTHSRTPNGLFFCASLPMEKKVVQNDFNFRSFAIVLFCFDFLFVRMRAKLRYIHTRTHACTHKHIVWHIKCVFLLYSLSLSVAAEDESESESERNWMKNWWWYFFLYFLLFITYLFPFCVNILGPITVIFIHALCACIQIDADDAKFPNKLLNGFEVYTHPNEPP